MIRHRRAALAALALVLAAGGAEAQTLGEALAAGTPILELRPRYESVDQAGPLDRAEAVTLRTRLGWETGAWRGLSGLVELEDVRDLGGEHNDGLTGAGLATIPDPEGTELNRLQLAWKPDARFALTLGRQRLAFDDQRFVGAVAWRQDEQTFDAGRIDLSAGGARVAIVRLERANRVLAEARDWDLDGWLVNAALPGPAAFRPVLFVYALDVEDAPSASSLTVGGRASGAWTAGGTRFAWAASLARQTDYGDSPANFTLGYGQAELAASRGPVTVKAAYERLEGDGARGFSTPLATLHAFQGWADAFLTTPRDGIEDASLQLAFKPAWRAPRFYDVQFAARWHDFTADRGGADLGEEVDVVAQASLSRRLSVLAKAADFTGAPGFADRTKVWFGLEYRY